MKTIKYLILIFIASLTLVSCDDFDADLDSLYEENPTADEAVKQVTAEQLFRRWYVASNSYDGPGLMTTTMADMNSCSWGNQGMKDMSSEPRVAWDNSASYGNATATETYFNELYSIMHDSNGLLSAIETGVLVPDSEEITKCLAYFGQSASIGYLALMFDQVWISDENGALNEGESLSPEDAIEYALNRVDKAILLANNNDFTLEIVNGHVLTSAQFSKFLNSFGARLLVNSVRNSTQRDAIDWTRVKNYALNGLDFDFQVLGDGWNNWYNEWSIYSVFPGWGRIDMRVIHLMDPSTIDYWTSDDPVLPESSSVDARLVSDFQYLTSQDFVPSRGLYHYSSYRHSRYDAELHGGGWNGEINEFLKAENDLYLAEAYLRLSDPISAAGVINNSSRVLRGGLADVASTTEAVAEAIHYERSVELLTTAMGLGYFEMRRENMLQAGTPLHFPPPGSQLLAGEFEIYTFGGSTGVAGQDYSEGGWR